MSYYPYQQPPAQQPPFGYIPPQSTPTPSPEVKPSRVPGYASATACFLLAVVLFNVWAIIGEGLLKLKSIWITAIGEIFIVAAVPLIFALVRKYDFKRVFSLNRISFRIAFLCFLTGLAAQFAVRLPSFLSNWLLQIFGPLYLPDQFDDSSPLGMFVTVAALVILAPLCEETLNRGFVLAGYRRMGFVRCIVVVGIFFGFFHQYPYRFLDTLCAGIVLAYLALTTGSIFASMAGHFGFNFFPAVILLFRNNIFEIMRQSDPNYNFADSNLLLITGDQLVASIFLSLFGMALVFLLLRAITRRTVQTRPGMVLGYHGLAKDVIENATTYENGPYYGPVNQPYRYTPLGYQPMPAPFPNYSRPGQTPRYKLVTAGWVVSVVLLLALFAFNSFAEFQLRAKGRDYCRQHPRECQSVASTVQNSEFQIQGLSK